MELIVNSASCWFILYGYITMLGQQNIKPFTVYTFNRKIVMYRKWCISELITVFNRQQISAHKYLMCFEGTEFGFRLPEGGVNKHLN